MKTTLFLTLTLIVLNIPSLLGYSVPSSDMQIKNVNTASNYLSRRSAMSVIQTTFATSIVSSTLLSPSSANAAYAKEGKNTNNKLSIISERISSNELTMPPPSRSSELNGVDNLYYPSWLSGTWDVTQTLVAASTPLGLKFIGGPNGSESIAAESWKEQQKQLDVPVKLQLRYIPTKFGVAEDRLFNTRQRLNSFAGKSVVATVEYANVGGSNRASVLALGGDNDTPLQTTLVYFKGPAAQKTFVLGHDSSGISSSSDTSSSAVSFAANESIRSIFALTNQNTAPPVTTDTELIWVFDKIDSDTVLAKLRIASYLNAQSDSLYFEARNRAVSFADYTLMMKRATI